MKDLLVTDHVELDSILEQLFSAFEKGEAAEIYQNLDYFFARLTMRIRAEDRHLFPSILRAVRKQEPKAAGVEILSSEFVRDSIRILINDHDFFVRELGEAVRQMFDLPEAGSAVGKSQKLCALREKLSALRRRLEAHNELEESFDYLWGETLNPAELPVLKSEIQRELENLPPRFSKAKAEIQPAGN